MEQVGRVILGGDRAPYERRSVTLGTQPLPRARRRYSNGNEAGRLSATAPEDRAVVPGDPVAEVAAIRSVGIERVPQGTGSAQPSDQSGHRHGRHGTGWDVATRAGCDRRRRWIWPRFAGARGRTGATGDA